MVMQQDTKVLKSVFLIVLLSFFYSAENGFAGEDESKAQPDFFDDFVATFKPQIKYSPADEPSVETESLPYWLQSWKDFKKQMEEKHGTSISILLDDHHQHILNGPGSRKGRNIFWWNLTVKKNLWDDGRLIFKARGSNTDGNPPNGITPLVGTKLNVDWAAYETELAYIANLYLEQKLMDDKLLVALGKLTFPGYFDENKVAGWDFFSHSLARNQAFIHKYHTIGALGRYDITDTFYMQAGITDVQGIRSETGLNTAFHGEDYFLTMAQMGIKTKNEQGLEGNYRFNIWYDPQPLTRHDGKGFERDTVGLGLNFDKAVTERTGAFLRYGWDDGRVRKFSNYWSIGGTRKGLIPDRIKDTLGLGIGQGITHHDYRHANNATHTETIVEAYYKIHMNDWYSITLDIQTLLNPGTNSHNDTSVIPGIRIKMLF
jgi:carbohydrate-selective porin OprB